MAYNEKEGLVDIFGGMDDLKAGIIRCVGNAQARFSEDALRILRGIRFAAQLGFELEDETREGMRLLGTDAQEDQCRTDSGRTGEDIDFVKTGSAAGGMEAWHYKRIFAGI